MEFPTNKADSSYNINSSLKNMIAGGASALITKLILYPLDTVKVRMQTQSSNFPIYKNSFHCFTNII